MAVLKMTLHYQTYIFRWMMDTFVEDPSLLQHGCWQQLIASCLIRKFLENIFCIMKRFTSILFKIMTLYRNIHTVDTKTVNPALRQTVTAISTTNTRCIIFKRGSFIIKVHIVYKILALVLAIISLLDQHKNTFTFTASRSGGDSFRVLCV